MVKQWKTIKSRPHHLAIPPSANPTAKAPVPYPQHLTPTPSVLQPHCLTQNQLRMWTPIDIAPGPPSAPALSKLDHKQMKDTMIHAWEEDTHVLYGAGLLMWHCFCNGQATPETERAPATQALLSTFVTHMATAYSGKTISNYLHGMRAWHLLHSIPWSIEKNKMDTMLRAVGQLTPSSSKRKKHCPYTPGFISAIWQHLCLESPLDAAVFACLTTCFYTLARLGKFMCKP